VPSGAHGSGAGGRFWRDLRISRGTDDLSGFVGVFGLRRRRATCSASTGPSGFGGGGQVIWFHRYFDFDEADGEHAGDGVVFGPRRGRRSRPEQRSLSGLSRDERLVRRERSFGSGRSGLRPPCFPKGTSVSMGSEWSRSNRAIDLRVAAQAGGVSGPPRTLGFAAERADVRWTEPSGAAPASSSTVRRSLRASADGRARLTFRTGFGPDGGLGDSCWNEGASALEGRRRSPGGSRRLRPTRATRRSRWVRVGTNARRGSAPEDGVRPRGRRKALKGAIP
jgi:hypothetical protein